MGGSGSWLLNNWQTGFVKTNGLRIHYYRTGGDLPQVVLNHGALDDGRCWPRLVKALEKEYDLIMPDARGHGLSDHGVGLYTSEARAEDLIGLIETLGLEKPLIGGHSIGGVTSLCAAAMRPDLIAGFFMEDPPITLPGETLFGGQSSQDNRVAIQRLIRAWRLIKAAPKFLSLHMIKFMIPSATPDVLESWLESKHRESEDFIQALEAPEWLAFSLDDGQLPIIKTPVMLIYGERDKGAIVSDVVASGVAERIEGLKVVHLAGASHDILRTQFADYLMALRDFAQSVMDR
jgi:pimeloyl-ACP methyl ester carboxylesterase